MLIPSPEPRKTITDDPVEAGILELAHVENVIITPETKRKVQKSTQRMRHARNSNNGYQRACRRRDWFSPVY